MKAWEEVLEFLWICLPVLVATKWAGGKPWNAAVTPNPDPAKTCACVPGVDRLIKRRL